MKVSRITAKNFRTLESFDLRLEPTYCAISGKNNAGKSSIVRIIQNFLSQHDEARHLFPSYEGITLSRDLTQWVTESEITIGITVEIKRNDDSEVFYVVEKYCDKSFESDTIHVTLKQIFREDTSPTTVCEAGGDFN